MTRSFAPARTLRGVLAAAAVCGAVAVSVASPAVAASPGTSRDDAAAGSSGSGAQASVATGFAIPSASALGTDVPSAVAAAVTTFPSEVLDADTSFLARVAVTNGSPTALDGASVRVRVTRQPLADGEAIDAFLLAPSGSTRVITSGNVGPEVEIPADTTTDTEDEADGEEAEPTTVSRLTSGSGTTLRLAVESEDLGFPDDEWGVYGVILELVTEDGTRQIDSGVVTWAGTDIPKLEVATVATAAGPASRVRAIAAASDLDGVAIVADPTSLTSVGATEVRIPAREAFLIPSLNPDLVSLAHAGDQTLVPYALERSRAALPDDSADLPWLGVLADLDAATLDWLTQHGAAGALLERAYLDSPSTGTEVTPAVARVELDEASVPVLLPEPELSAQVADEPSSEPTSAGAVLAHAALIAGQAEAPVLISPGVKWVSHTDGPSSGLGAVLDAPFVTSVTVASLLESTDAPTIAVPALSGQGDDVPRDSIEELTDTFADIGVLATVADDETQVIDPAATTLIAPLATRLREIPETREGRIDFALQQVNETLDALGVAAGSDVNLIAASGSVPVTVRNGLDVDATVVVDVTSLSPNLQIRDAPTVTIPAGQTQSVLIEVEAVSSADVVTIVELRAPGGETVGTPATLSVRVRADWGNAVTAVFTAGLVLLLVAGVWRTVRRGRKDTRTGPQATPEMPPEADGDEPATQAADQPPAGPKDTP